MLIPRPLYSKKITKRIMDYADNVIRFLLRNIVKNIDGLEQWKNIKDFEDEYKEVIEKLGNKNKKILISTVYVDERYFYNTNQEYEKYNKIIKKIADENNYKYIDLYDTTKKIVENNKWDKFYLKDHFHPNKKGYEIIAKEIATRIKEK